MESVIPEVPKILNIDEDNSLNNSLVKFIDGNTGYILYDQWDKVVEKEMVINADISSTSKGPYDNIKVIKPVHVNN